MEVKSDIEIAQACAIKPIRDIAAVAGVDEEYLEYYGKYKAKIDLKLLDDRADRPDGKLILVTAINPTPAGEGKTTTTVGLADGMRRLGKNTVVALREPSLGPVFGVKGGAAGGGYAQVIPMEDINLHFTGDFHAIGAANNLLAAMLDNHIQQGNILDIDVRRITWKRCVDMNDRQLRNIVCGLGGKVNGVPREDGFDITVASEIMAVLCLADSLTDLKARLGRMVVAYSRSGAPVTAHDLRAEGAMAALLKDALKPNLVVAASPETGATTHAGVLSGAIEYLRDHGFRDISIIEGSWVGDDTGRAFRAAGYEAVGKKYGVPLFDLKRDKTRRVDTPLRPMDICCRALDADYLINLPVLKGHCQTAMTCALKNCKGCLPDREKRRFHAEGLMRPIAALAAALRPELTIVDSLCGDLDFEEGGNPVPTGRMLLGEDPVQLDAYGCRLMGLALEQAPYIQMAEAWGAGSTRLEGGDVVRLNEPSAAADYPAPSGAVAALTRTVQARSACSACYASLVRALHTSGVQGLPIAIGQGWRGIPFDGLGIGACCNYAKERVPGCPPPAEDILRVLSARC